MGRPDVEVVVRARTKNGRRHARRLAGEVARALSDLNVAEVVLLRESWPASQGDGLEARRDRFRDLALVADDAVEIAVSAEEV